MNHLDDYTLNEYLDHMLSDTVRGEVEAHLQFCVACNTKLDELSELFAKLDEVSEVHLEHDLTPAILTHLPRRESTRTWIWTRALVAQLGVVAGFIFWLGIQMTPLIGIPQFSQIKVSPIEMQSVFMRLLSIQFSIPEFRILDFNYQMPTINFQMPALAVQLSTTHAAALAISTLLLWVVGNVILLKCRREG